MCTFSSLCSWTWWSLHVAVDPAESSGNSAIYSWVSCTSTPNTPADDTYQGVGSGWLLGRQGPAAVSLTGVLATFTSSTDHITVDVAAGVQHGTCGTLQTFFWSQFVYKIIFVTWEFVIVLTVTSISSFARAPFSLWVPQPETTA